MNRCHMQGYLLKRNKEHRRANILGVKYKKRWVELTTDTLVYSKSQQELLSGRIQVFAVQELVWVRAEAEAKFVVKFKDRTLTFKVENGGSAERDKWVSVLQACKQRASDVDGQESCPSGKLGQLIKDAEQQLVDLPSPSPQSSSTGGVQALKPHSPDLAPPQFSNESRKSSYGQFSPGVGSQAPPSSHDRVATARQLSPRSLLASAKLGSAFVTSTSDAGDSSQAVEYSEKAGQQHCTPFSKFHQQATSSYHIGDADDSDTDEDEDDMACGTQRHVQVGSNPAQNSEPKTSGTGTEAALQHQQQRAAIDNASNSPGSPTRDSGTLERGDSDSLDSSALAQQQQRDRRATLTRRLTPGVMLLNIGDPASSSPSPITSTNGSGSLALADRPFSHTKSSASRRIEEPAQSVQAQQQPQPSCCPVPASDSSESDEDLSGGILRLDPDEVLGCSKDDPAIACKHRERHMSHGNRVQAASATSCRPGSAPYAAARPSTALKSCLRKGGGNIGSMSTPTRSSAMMSSVEAALRSSPHEEVTFHHLNPSRLSTPSNGKESDQQQEDIQQSSNWLHDDWDSSDHEDPTCASPEVATDSGRVVDHSSGPQPSKQKAPAGASQSPIAPTSIGIRGATLGVKADKAWLEDDFDS